MSANEKTAVGQTKHDQIIGALTPRWWLSEDCRFTENVWIVDTSRKNQERVKAEVIRFDVPIMGWPNFARLDDPSLEFDLITAKLLVYLSLEPPPIGWLTTASSVGPFHRRHTNFIRFKHEWNIGKNSNIRPAHVRHFERCLRTPGLEALLRVEAKAVRLVDAFQTGELEIPFHERGYFFHEGLEALLGLSLNQTPPGAVAVLQQFAKDAGIRFQRNERVGLTEPRVTKRRTSVSALMSPFYHLSRLRGFLEHDPIGFDAFNDAAELAGALKGWTEETQRTSDSPSFQTSWLINGALKLILSDLPEMIIEVCLDAAEAKDKVANKLNLNELNTRFIGLGFNTVGQYYRRSRWLRKNELDTSLRDLLFNILAGSCAIVVAAFSGRRDGEIMALRSGCIHEDAFGEGWLECWISKRQRYTTRLPANQSTKRAISILEIIRQRTSGDSKAWLFEFADPSGPVKFELNTALSTTSKWFRVPAMLDGSHWAFGAHQMRKFFAVTHQWRYFFPELMVLNFQLQQRDRNVTAAYTRMEAGKALRLHDERRVKRKETAAQLWSAEDRVAALKEEEQAMVRYVCQNALTGDLSLAGPRGKTLYSDLTRLVEAQLHVTTSGSVADTFNKTLEEFYSGLSMQVHPEGHSICTCGSSTQDKAVAGCLRLKEHDLGLTTGNETGPDYTYAEDECCASCPHNLRLKVLMPYWIDATDQAQAALRSSSQAVRDVAQERVSFLEGMLAEFDYED
ncbi:hypothetical protein [Rhizobium laguerreae]|uniref:hypothetical protein n=1 Tax=Rhizobium laguerreae TaxID=1076926 RepID=UPI001C91BA0D|nr:hypothetical protein [Rhizobium laguerreae]MBY3367261.1 hypothetical protein [Rhizobium laguerreae]